MSALAAFRPPDRRLLRGLCPCVALALWCLPSAASAQSVERPTLPFRSLAGEDGVHTLFTNPALMNFDRDPGYAAYYDTTNLSGADSDGLSGLTIATSGSGVGAGIGWRQIGPEATGWWTVTSGASIRVAEQLTFGSSVNWQLPDGGDNNFVSWDIGAGWRPAPFLGFAATVLNLGNPAPDLGVYTRYGAGLAVRPAGDAVTVGVDYLNVAPPDTASDHQLQTSLRIKPARGLWLRLYGRQSITTPDQREVGGALEVHFADAGFGLDARSSLTSAGGIGGGGYIQTIPKDDQLFLSGKEVALFELESRYPYAPAVSLLSAPEESYLTLLRRINDAANARHVRGMVFVLDRVPFNFAQIEEIRGLVIEARARGKHVVAYLGGEASNGAYLLASACDKVYLHPAGNLDLVGISAELQYFRGTLDLVGVSAQYAKRGEFKSAPEQWTNEKSSDASREEMNALLDDLSATLVAGVATGRGKSEADVRALIDQGPFTSEEAIKNGLVDGLIYRDQLEKELENVFDHGFSTNDSFAEDPDTSGWAPQRAVAVVIVDGVIASGRSSPGGFLGGAATGSETVVRQLDQARRSSAVKAVVLRVDSPGGSAFASDEIWRAVKRVRDAGKPVIVSMGGYAASGGYYVAAGANAIYALPTTITGSIGVYGGKFNAKGLFEKLNVGTEQFSRGRNASMNSLATPFDELQFAALDRMIADTYRQFKEKVQEGRSLPPERVEEVARGRVWSGSAARARGLVDEDGGFFDAVDRARAEAGMRADAPYSLVTFDSWGGGAGDFPARLVRAMTPRVELPKEISDFWSLAALRDERIYAILPYRMEIR